MRRDGGGSFRRGWGSFGRGGSGSFRRGGGGSFKRGGGGSLRATHSRVRPLLAPLAPKLGTLLPLRGVGARKGQKPRRPSGGGPELSQAVDEGIKCRRSLLKRGDAYARLERSTQLTTKGAKVTL